MKICMVNKLVYSESAGRILKPGELWGFEDAAVSVLMGRGVVESWNGEMPLRRFVSIPADPELDKLKDQDL